MNVEINFLKSCKIIQSALVISCKYNLTRQSEWQLKLYIPCQKRKMQAELVFINETISENVNICAFFKLCSS